jgi:hypothetical protein
MPSLRYEQPATSDDVFEALLALAKARVIVLTETRRLTRADGNFVLRALFDLEADGVEFFGDARPADITFFDDVAGYLHARAGATAVDALALAPAPTAALVARADREGRRALALLGGDGESCVESSIARAVLKMIHQWEVDT